MKTRDLTPSERAIVDTAWDEYLDASERAESIRDLNQAWAKYNDALQTANIHPTLAGYRKFLT